MRISGKLYRSLAVVLLWAFAAVPSVAAANGTLVDTGHSIIKAPVYPGAMSSAPKHLSENLNASLGSPEGYTTGASVDTVYNWYVAHTHGYTHHIVHYNGATTANLELKTPKLYENIVITRVNGVTNIDMSQVIYSK